MYKVIRLLQCLSCTTLGSVYSLKTILPSLNSDTSLNLCCIHNKCVRGGQPSPVSSDTAALSSNHISNGTRSVMTSTFWCNTVSLVSTDTEERWFHIYAAIGLISYLQLQQNIRPRQDHTQIIDIRDNKIQQGGVSVSH